ncbi:hypothetical protein CHS0354_005721 [Potamilus streckersoni]|uniref:ADP-ribosylation factor-binding protein GGA3 n=1 Tax=Potamilus streckersoni TaxID=2493646 RepID=A0AAE0RW21_9BIVA|nr:hypothetical protein CHS0354_005721 [Potamilus streckersoni]
MAEDEERTLESLLNRAINPAKREEDWEYIKLFCDKVNIEIEGPQVAVRLLAHKIQSPQEREALFALTVLESCVKQCGKRFHQEIGKFRFLNEIIKVLSPKYLGTKTTEKVKKKCVEIVYSWYRGLPLEPKIEEAYRMLKQQGIITEDPTYVDKLDLVPEPPPRPKNAVFEDDEKAKLLAKLLKSKNPDDLQAANRLIKNMVKQDAERMEKVSQRINDLETINNNTKLLREMVGHYNPSTTSQSEKETMKELFDSLEKLRPKLFRLASESDEKDSDGLSQVLRANDDVMLVMSLYRHKVEEVEENGHPEGNKPDGTSLLDLTFDPSSPSKNFSSSYTSFSQGASGSHKQHSEPVSSIDDDLLALGLATTKSIKEDSRKGDDSLLSELDDLFSYPAISSAKQPVVSQAHGAVPLMMVSQPAPMFGGPSISQPMMYGSAPQVPTHPVPGNLPATSVFSLAPANIQQSQKFTSYGLASQGVSFTQPQSQPQKPGPTTPKTDQQKKALLDLDDLGQSLMQQNLGPDKPVSFTASVQPAKVTLNQIASKVPTISPPPYPGSPTAFSSASVGSTSTASVPQSIQPPTVSMAAEVSAHATGSRPGEVQPLTDIFVPLENIKPGSHPPVNTYDKNGIKVLIHAAQDRPREDVVVMVISVMSINTNPVKGFIFQAAVPKVMKVKLQPPSATDLPAFNPILPPSAITQVMLIANPQKEKIRLKFKITYTCNDQSFTDVGDVDSFQVQ